MTRRPCLDARRHFAEDGYCITPARADGGRLLLPMTAERGRGGFTRRVDRPGNGLAARSAGWTAFYPRVGTRDGEEQAALSQSLDDNTGQQAVRSLRRDRHARDETCWLHGDGWCLSKREVQ